MDFKKINQIIEIFKNSGLGEMSIELKDLKINMKSAQKEVITYSNVLKEDISNTVSTSKEVVEPKVENKGTWVKSPFVGTFYSSPSPDAKAFVQVGQVVKEGDVLFILEAMKVMNEIKSTKSGKILEIKGINGEMVEYDQELILIGD